MAEEDVGAAGYQHDQGTESLAEEELAVVSEQDVAAAAVVVSAAAVVVVVENRSGGEIVSHNCLEAAAGEHGSVVLEIIFK